MSNVWLLVSVENQETADERIPELLRIREYGKWPVLGASVEPMLEGIDIKPYLGGIFCDACFQDINLDWVVCGCESGPRRRPVKLSGVRMLRYQCNEADVPFFLKQIEIGGKVSHNPAEWPDNLQVQEWPIMRYSKVGGMTRMLTERSGTS